jgi:hypothetical protein
LILVSREAQSLHRVQLKRKVNLDRFRFVSFYFFIFFSNPDFVVGFGTCRFCDFLVMCRLVWPFIGPVVLYVSGLYKFFSACGLREKGG